MSDLIYLDIVPGIDIIVMLLLPLLTAQLLLYLFSRILNGEAFSSNTR
jgi:hypothetical protein